MLDGYLVVKVEGTRVDLHLSEHGRRHYASGHASTERGATGYGSALPLGSL
jgi:hypothetical protein